MNIMNPTKEILVNNLKRLEDYLEVDVRDEKKLQSLNLYDNLSVRGVRELLSIIPDGYYPNALKVFYEKTGLKIHVEVYKDNYEVVIFDKEGRYPREDAALWNQEFVEKVSEHPEWLEPQDEADILVRYIFPHEESDECEHFYQFCECNIFILV